MKKRGITLVEITLVVTIIGIITPIFYNLIDYQYKSFAMVEKKATQSRHERMIYSIMHNQVRFAKDIKFFDKVPTESTMKDAKYDGYQFLWLDSDGEINLSTQELNLKSTGEVNPSKKFKNRIFGKLAIKYGDSDSHKLKSIKFVRKDDKILEYDFEGQGNVKFEGAVRLVNKTELPEAPKAPEKIVAIAYRPFYEELDWK